MTVFRTRSGNDSDSMRAWSAASGRPEVKRIASRPGTGTPRKSMLDGSAWASVNCTGVAPGVPSVIHKRPSLGNTARLFDNHPPKYTLVLLVTTWTKPSDRRTRRSEVSDKPTSSSRPSGENTQETAVSVPRTGVIS